MPSEEIITGLRNAITHGESLQNAMQVMINSGYNPAEVKEASRFIGAGAMQMQQPKPDEQLIMPEKKKKIPLKFLSKLKFWEKKTKQSQVQPIQEQPQPQQLQPIKEQSQQFPSPQPIQQISPQQQTKPLSKQLQKIKPKTSHLKEIILLVILLMLIGLLITTIVFREKILAWFA